MIADFRSTDAKQKRRCAWLTQLFAGTGRCLVNGREVPLVHYIDSTVVPHVVRSYDVLNDGRIHTVQEFSQEVRRHWTRSIGILPDGVLSKTVRGQIVFQVPTKQLHTLKAAR